MNVSSVGRLGLCIATLVALAGCGNTPTMTAATPSAAPMVGPPPVSACGSEPPEPVVLPSEVLTGTPTSAGLCVYNYDPIERTKVTVGVTPDPGLRLFAALKRARPDPPGTLCTQEGASPIAYVATFGDGPPLLVSMTDSGCKGVLEPTRQLVLDIEGYRALNQLRNPRQYGTPSPWISQP